MPHAAPPGGSGGGSDDAWSPRAIDPGPAPPPTALPGYRDFVLVASGGDSLVYRAIQDGVNRPVAVKVLAGEADGVPAARYQRELEITVRLGRAHPNIVTVLDTQILPDGRPCIVMEYYELGSLQDQLRTHGPLPSSAAVAAGTVVADALAYAHREGVLHRDVKPQNILVLPTSYVLADFGLARRIDAGHTSSLERFSYRHASPQVLDGELPTVADDIYALGSTLFTLLDGRPPFAVDEPESDSALAYLRRARSELPRPIRSSDATPELLAIIDRCLAKRREDRFPDAMMLRDALRGVVTEARVWARTWQPQVIPGREPVRNQPPSAPTAGPPSPAIPGPTSPAVPAGEGTRADATKPTPAVARPSSAPPTRRPAPARHWTTEPPGPDPVRSPGGVPASPRGGPVADPPTPIVVPRLEPPTPRIITPAPIAAPSSLRPAPADIPGPVTAPQPVVAPVRPHPDGMPARGRRFDRTPDRVAPARITPQWTDEPGHDDRRYDRPYDGERFDGDGYDDGPSDPRDGRGDDSPRRGRPGWPRVLLLAVVALLLGTAIGLGGSWLLAVLNRSPVQTVPQLSGSVPGNATPGQRNTALDPEITELNVVGSSIELAWEDPTDGQVGFAIRRVEGGRDVFVQQIDPGTTRTVIADLDPDAEQYCFQVVAFSLIDSTQAGFSDVECAQR